MHHVTSLRPTLYVLLSLLWIGCGGSNPTSLEELPPDLIVTWYATSVRVDGSELLDDGMRLVVKFAADGTYLLDASWDRTGFVCEPGVWDCVVDGTFEASTTEVVFDPGEDEARLGATLAGTDLRLFGNVEGMSVDMSFVVPPYPDLIGTWVAMALLDSIGEMEEGGARTTLVMTFEADGSYSYASTFSPPDVFCDVSVSCLGQGSYVAEQQELRFDPGTAEALTMELSMSPTQLMLYGLVEGGTQDWTFGKLELPAPGLMGKWWAISLEYDGVELVNSGAVHQLFFDDLSYSSTTIADAPGPFLCGPGSTPPDCSSGGSYTADFGTLDFLDGLAQGPQSVSLTITSNSLRLTGIIDGKSADFLYARDRWPF